MLIARESNAIPVWFIARERHAKSCSLGLYAINMCQFLPVYAEKLHAYLVYDSWKFAFFACSHIRIFEFVPAEKILWQKSRGLSRGA